jgi:hypothetical protein
MATTTDSLRATSFGQNLSISRREQMGCQSALIDAHHSGNLAVISSLQKLGLLETTTFKREYGPSFETDNALLVLFGWLLTTMIAATAAPSASDLLQRYLRR